MIRIVTAIALGIGMCAFLSSAVAEDKKPAAKAEVLNGTICCGKCELKESATCAVTIVVKGKGGSKTYWFDATSSKKYHGDVCSETKEGTVTGTVKKDGKKMVITVSELKYK